MSEASGKLILSLSMQPNDAHAVTVGDYLAKLLRKVWSDGEGFDGKRPFGNSSWESELYEALARVGLISARMDHDDNGYYDFDEAEGNRLIELAIDELTRV